MHQIVKTPAGLLIPISALTPAEPEPEPEPEPFSYRNKVIGVRARDRSEIESRGASVRGERSPSGVTDLITAMLGEKKPRLRNYNSVLRMENGEEIVGPAIKEVEKREKRVLFQFETWILLGPWNMLGFILLTPERRFVMAGDLSFVILDGDQNQLTMEVELGHTIPKPEA